MCIFLSNFNGSESKNMKTHLEVLEETERHFLSALIACDRKLLQYYMHPAFTYSSDSGEIFKGFQNIPILNPEKLCVDTISILDRNVNIYNNVAIVLTFEHRTGSYMGIAYNNKYRNTRVWKFTGKRWHIISAISYLFN